MKCAFEAFLFKFSEVFSDTLYKNITNIHIAIEKLCSSLDHEERKESLDELTRKVDWLYEEVRYIKQTLDTYRRSRASTLNYDQPGASYRTYEHHSRSIRDQNNARQEVPRSNVLTVPVERSRYYEEHSHKTIDGRTSLQNYLPTTICPTPHSDVIPRDSTPNSHHSISSRCESSYEETMMKSPRIFTSHEIPLKGDRDSIATHDLPIRIDRDTVTPNELPLRRDRDTITPNELQSKSDQDTMTSRELSMRGDRDTMTSHELSSRNDREMMYNNEDSPVSNITVKSDRGGSTELLCSIPEDITIAEVVILWERGMNDVPPAVEWDAQSKTKNREKLEIFFKVYHIFRVVCKSDLSLFASQYTDNLGRMKSPEYVASLCPDVSEAFETFLQVSKPQVFDLSIDKLYTLPRKINGRKVSAKDVIQLWEFGMGDVPPIKSWTKAQKFKQQSKISRWKKIVDIFKYQCNSDMRKFEEIYTDSHGCLLPVAAITNKFETLYGDELNITSKLMTVSTTEQQQQQQQQQHFQQQQEHQQHDLHHIQQVNDEANNRKRKITEDSLSDGDSTNGYHTQAPFDEDDHEQNISPSLPPLLLPATSVRSPHKLVKVEDETHSVSSNQESACPLKTSENLTPVIGTDKSIIYEDQSSPSSINSTTNEEAHERKYKRSTSIIYILPDTFTIKEAIMFWDTGSREFPPVKTWTHVQNSIQQDLILKIEKLYEIFVEHFHRDIDALLSNVCDTNGEELPIEQFINNYTHQDARKIPNANSMTFDFSHHKTISQCTDALYLLPRKINGRKVSAKDVLQLWYHGLNKIPPVKQWSPQQKAVQQSKISRWKKIVELFEQDFAGDWDKFKMHYSNSLGQLLPITAIISRHEEESRSMTEGGGYHPKL